VSTSRAVLSTTTPPLPLWTHDLVRAERGRVVATALACGAAAVALLATLASGSTALATVLAALPLAAAA
jgi:hypothetical protein